MPMKRTVGYAVIESTDTDGIKQDLSHWFFKSYDAAIRFADQMSELNRDNETDFRFTVVTLISGEKNS